MSDYAPLTCQHCNQRILSTDYYKRKQDELAAAQQRVAELESPPLIRDETEITEIIICNQRAYKVPRDVARESAALREQVATLREDAERLRSGLQWYADGNHHVLDDAVDGCWEEEEGWLCPPTEDSWMVEAGHVAKAVLDGNWINPNHRDADDICVGPVRNKSHHEACLARIEELMKTNPDKDSLAGKELLLLVGFVETYEKAIYPIAASARKIDHHGGTGNG